MSFFDNELKISVITGSGLEAVTKRELKDEGIVDEAPANFGKISFKGSYLDMARCNMFLRSANRVYIELITFCAETFDELFENINNFSWESVMPSDAKIIVLAKSVKSTLFALSSIQSIAKKAIVEKLKKKYKLNNLPESGDTYTLQISLRDNIVSVELDTSGDGLHKRGYRNLVGLAPLRETTAAAIILLSVWKKDRALIDPFCGSGTIPIEAALIATNTAPGISRSFAYQNFSFAKNVYSKILEEANDIKKTEADLRISGFDIDKKQIEIARIHAKNADMDKFIHFQAADMRTLSSRYSHGVIITNPPYGERLSGGRELETLYRDFSKVFFSLDEWSLYLLTSAPNFEYCFNKKADKKRKLFNSELETTLYRYLGKPPKSL